MTHARTASRLRRRCATLFTSGALAASIIACSPGDTATPAGSALPAGFVPGVAVSDLLTGECIQIEEAPIAGTIRKVPCDDDRAHWVVATIQLDPADGECPEGVGLALYETPPGGPEVTACLEKP